MLNKILCISSLLILMSTSSLAAEQFEKNSPLTHGNVQINLKKGVTSQNEVLENFGPPNIMTTDAEENEVWTYQKMSTSGESKSRRSYGTLIIAGTEGETVGFKQSSKTMTLIIKFSPDKKVKDFKSYSSSF